jgi:hypothetical protein
MWDLIFCEGGVSLNLIDTLNIKHVQPNLSPKKHWAYPDLGALLNWIETLNIKPHFHNFTQNLKALSS